MSEDHTAPAVTIRIPAPRVLDEAAARTPDTRTTEVLRAVQRARRTIVGAEVPTSSPTTETLVRELQALREWLSMTSSVNDETARRLASCTGVLERVVVIPVEKVADFQRSHDAAVRELRESAHALKRQADGLAAWRPWWTKQVSAWAVVLAVLLSGGIAFAWRAHALARSTHDILEQILDNQAKAHAARGGKR
jgi:hypothetical protein